MEWKHEKKIAFFDIDGTLTSEIDGSIPASVAEGIRRARAMGHKMFINTGRCASYVESRFRDIGFDGLVCGCGTNIFYEGQELYHRQMPENVKMEILARSRLVGMDLLLEGRDRAAFDDSHPLRHPEAKEQYDIFCRLRYDIAVKPDDPMFIADKFVAWFEREEQLREFRKCTDRYFQCIDRTGNFREFVPIGNSKGTGIQYLLDHFHMNIEQAYAFGDSNNDMPMLEMVPHSVVMGNALPESVKDGAFFVAKRASEDGIYDALEQLGFFEE